MKRTLIPRSAQACFGAAGPCLEPLKAIHSPISNGRSISGLKRWRMFFGACVWLALILPARAALDAVPSSRASGVRNSGVLIGDLGLVILAALGVALGVAAGLVVWAKYLRKSSGTTPTRVRKDASHRRSASDGHSGRADEEAEPEEESDGVIRRRRKRRRPRRDHRPRNPTLAETGGLPPPKEPNPPSPAT